MKITFYGAAQEVPGSRHIIEYEGKRILLDCGMFQGRREEARERNSDLGFDPNSIDVAVLSHAHIDHCGLLPLLVRQGYKGKIYATPATKEVTRYMLLDSAAIQESDYEYLKKKKVPKTERLAKPLYTLDDVPPTMRKITTHDYVRNGGGWIEILPGVELKFYDAGHILGSAVSVLQFKRGRSKFRVGFTGDLGKRNSPLLHNPHYIKEKVDVLISESTYGGQVHGNVQDAHDKLVQVVDRIVKTKGKLIIPAFSLGRTQEVVYILHHLTDSGLIPRIPIYVDSPLATRLTGVFRKFRADYDIESRLDFPRKGDVPLAFRNLKYTQNRDESIALNNRPGPLIIISASGMAEAGRVLHHLKHTLRSGNNTVLFTGYQAAHTLGRKLLEGRSPVRVYGRLYRVNAQIETLNELSAHADGPQLVDYITHCKGLERVFLVHGEGDRAQELKKLILEKADLDVVVPQRKDSFLL